MKSSSLTSFVSYIVTRGYYGIMESESPIKFKGKILYFKNNEGKYSACRDDGSFITWADETEHNYVIENEGTEWNPLVIKK